MIEDSAIFNPAVGETFVIVNPGQGINSTFNGFWNFLYGAPTDCTHGCPANQKVIPAARSYDGVEFRITRQPTHHWLGMFSYTYSNFRGNYTGLTSSDVADGGGGRNAPNNSRSFDEPYFSWNAKAVRRAACCPPIVQTRQGLRLLQLPMAAQPRHHFRSIRDGLQRNPADHERTWATPSRARVPDRHCEPRQMG